MNMNEIIEAMKNCEQTKGQSVHEHGVSVFNHLMVLINHLKNNSDLQDWRLPDWIKTYKEQLLKAMLPFEIIENYARYHDIGKPHCLVIDADGKRHFPNHAQVSHDTWIAAGGDEQTAKLILWDMDIHTMKAEQLEEFCQRKEAITLLLTGLSELHSNARMFGGIDSTSFKIKWKQIDKRGKAICKKLFDTV